METVEKSIEVEVPVSAAYNQWTQFEEFPLFMQDVKEVRQLDDKRVYWKARIAGRDKEWEAEIFEQIPDQRIAWRSTKGTKCSGRIEFASITPDKTHVTVHLSYETQGAVESVGDALGVVGAHVQGNLKRFKEFIEERGLPTGSWRGEIHGRDVRTAGQP
jgi:uncharacterized membrane protein